jgi:replication factor C subunit 2/4
VLSEEAIVEIMSVIPSSLVTGFINACTSPDSRAYEHVDSFVRNLLLEGYAATALLSQVFDAVIALEGEERKKGAVLERIALVDKRLADGADEYVQVMDVAVVLMQMVATV